MKFTVKVNGRLWLAIPPILALIPAGLAFHAWIVMLLIGGIHGSISESVPALGFWPSLLVVIALAVVGSFFKRGSN